MRLLNKLFTPLFLATASLLAAPLSTGCTAHGELVVDEPPAPREEVVEARPGFVFIHGNWQRRGGQWEWRAGRYERERPGHAWVEGRWEPRGNGRVWVEGRWS
jgi:WXXGXW repeat (2 copies)